MLVNQVHPDGPAARAGIAKGDVILAVDGREVQDPKALNFRLAIGALGEEAELEVWRRGAPDPACGCRSRRPPYRPEPQPTTLEGRQPLAGATVANLSPGLNKDLDLDLFQRGVVVLKVERGSPAAQLRLRRGDRVTRVGDQTIGDVAQLTTALRRARPPWRLEVERDGQRLAVVITG